MSIEEADPKLDMRLLSLAKEIAAFLEAVKDEGSPIDSGTDGTSADLSVFVQGVEYWINIKKG